MFFPNPQSPLVEARTSKLNLQEELPGFRNLHFISSGYKIWAWETSPGEVTSMRFHPFSYQQYICKILMPILAKHMETGLILNEILLISTWTYNGNDLFKTISHLQFSYIS